jgi:glycosyltransferase involved in cell wall biosynthesis
VFFEGAHADLQGVFGSARLFVAPARFSAGIPLKVVTAASYGLPAAASTLLVRQLGWRTGREIVDAGESAATFAAAVTRACSDEELWMSLQAGALARVGSDYSRERMKRTIDASLRGEVNRRE